MAVILGLLKLTCLGLHVPHIIRTLHSSLRRQQCLKELLRFAKYCLDLPKGSRPSLTGSHVIVLVAIHYCSDMRPNVAESGESFS